MFLSLVIFEPYCIFMSQLSMYTCEKKCISKLHHHRRTQHCYKFNATVLTLKR